MPSDKWFRLFDLLFGVGQLVCAALIFVGLIFLIDVFGGFA